MAKYLLKRTAQILLTLFVFLSLVFFIVNAQPGDVSNFYALNPDVPPETRERLQDLFGVNEPLWKQYLTHLRNTVHRELRHLLQPLPAVGRRRDQGAAAEDGGAVHDRDRALLLPGVRAREGTRVAQGRMVRVHVDRRRRGAIHGVHPMVRPDDDLAVRLQGGLVPDREVPRPGPVAGRAGRRQYDPSTGCSSLPSWHPSPCSLCSWSRPGGGWPGRHHPGLEHRGCVTGHHRRLARLGNGSVRVGHRQSHGAARADAHADQLRGHHAADPQQHARDHAGGLRDGRAGEGAAGARRAGTSTSPGTRCCRSSRASSSASRSRWTAASSRSRSSRGPAWGRRSFRRRYPRTCRWRWARSCSWGCSWLVAHLVADILYAYLDPRIRY